MVDLKFYAIREKSFGYLIFRKEGRFTSYSVFPPVLSLILFFVCVHAYTYIGACMCVCWEGICVCMHVTMNIRECLHVDVSLQLFDQERFFCGYEEWMKTVI